MPVYVQHEVLGNISDVFNAEAIWQAPGLALFSRRPLLRDLLERSPREHRGRTPTRCFSHVALMLPQEDVDDDRHLTRGARMRDLVESLKALHQKDFGDLLGGEEVRYDVIGTDALPSGAIEVKFGHAVYLPAPGEKILYQVSASRDGAIWKPVCPVYTGQRLLVVGNEGESVSHAVHAWPFGDAASVLVINDGPDSPVEVQVRPRNALDCSYDAIAGCYTVSARERGPDGKAQRVFLKITRIAAPDRSDAADPRSATVWKLRGAEPTVVPPAPRQVEQDATFAPVAQQRVSLVALALPRLSRYRETGVQQMRVALDAQLRLARPGEAATIGFTVNAADEVFAESGDGSGRIDGPATLTPVEGRTVQVLAPASAMAERYSAVLRLPVPLEAPVSGGARLTFGRGNATLGQLRVLDSSRFVASADGRDAGSADRIGLSRNAFSFEAVKDGYRIVRQSQTQALYHLDPSFAYVGAIDNGPEGEPYLLPAGHHLVAGHYVLRFDA
ncbi:hypothetical protein [Pseudoduganella sp. GCM10020061]|uniref:hypothetical protein n=1 Tax=Pseudoduganella sp. GCM10020061 TaxID=3317345 RepID=UPI003640C8EB